MFNFDGIMCGIITRRCIAAIRFVAALRTRANRKLRFRGFLYRFAGRANRHCPRLYVVRQFTSPKASARPTPAHRARPYITRYYLGNPRCGLHSPTLQSVQKGIDNITTNQEKLFNNYTSKHIIFIINGFHAPFLKQERQRGRGDEKLSIWIL